MQALLTTGPEGQGLALGETPEPEPASDQVVVTLTATSLNRGEVRHLGDEEPGTVLGWDVVGTVAQTAADGSGPALGSRVVGIVDQGAWAERVAVYTHALAEIPDAVTDADAAVLPIAGLTASTNTVIDDTTCIETSFPEFPSKLLELLTKDN